jgi:hypothetical protein
MGADGRWRRRNCLGAGVTQRCAGASAAGAGRWKDEVSTELKQCREPGGAIQLRPIQMAVLSKWLSYPNGCPIQMDEVAP